MADDAAAPEGELSESTPERDDAPRDKALKSRASDTGTSTTSPDETTESPQADTEGDDAPRDEALRSRASNTEGDDAPRDEALRSRASNNTDTDIESADDELDPVVVAEPKPGMSHVRLATIIGLVVVVALAGTVGWLGFRAYESHKAEAQRELFLQVGRQGAVNLTTIDFEHADADVQRILDSATDTFYDDFSKRSQPFVDVVKQAQSKSVGTVTSAGLESENADTAQVLVAVTVKTSNAGAAEQQPRAWRMRILVKKVGDDAKVSNVEFVP